jgi:hypothetical protein
MVADENFACDGCGNFGALEIGNRRFCADRVVLAGSSSAGSSADNGSWRRRNQAAVMALPLAVTN